MNRIKMKKSGALLLSVLLILAALFLPAAAKETRPTVLLGGIPFGVRFSTDGVFVVSYCDIESGGKAQNPAREAGILPGDTLMRAEGQPLCGTADLAAATERAAGAEMHVVLRRGEEEKEVTLSPLACDKDGKWRIGLFVRDSGGGIGTMTFLTPDTHLFGGLGHAICDGESKMSLPIARGSVLGVKIGSVRRGTAGCPGELRGHFSKGKIGSFTANTECGVFGVLSECPAGLSTRVEIARRDEVVEGDATLICTVEGDTPRAYRVTISEIHTKERGNKCFTVRVRDPELIGKTGGIVQGMSGSPLVQNGRLIGAVTHVLLAEPTFGYGIFIENMLDAMEGAFS